MSRNSVKSFMYLKKICAMIKKIKICVLMLLLGFGIELSAKNIFWSVEYKGNTVYLLGSIHIADDSIYPLDSVIYRAFESSEYFVLEMDPTSINPFEIMKYTNYHGDTLLKNMVSQELYDRITTLMKKHKVPEMAYSSMKPYSAISTIFLLEMMSYGFSKTAGIDLYFLEKARNAAKVVKELESFEIQMGFMDKLNDYPEEFLDFTLGELEESKQQVKDLLTAWKAGDTDKIWEITHLGQDTEGFEQFMEEINYSRNVKMTETIVDYLESGEVHFVVVGALHLLGERGIINFLENRGDLKIKRL